MTQRTSMCEVCALPAPVSPCSERCRNLSSKKRELEHQAELAAQLIGERVANLKAGATQCPGLLAHAVASELRLRTSSAQDSLLLMRSIYLSLRNRYKLRFYQKGKVVPLARYPKGAFRIGR